MSAFVLALVLTAALCHAAWNVIAHRVSGIGLPFLWWGGGREHAGLGAARPLHGRARHG